MASLTTKALEALKPTDQGKRISDGNRLRGVVRVIKSDPQAVSIDFEWRYNFAGKIRHIRVGTWPKMTLKAIRDQRAALMGKVSQGIDPLAEKEVTRLKKLADQIEARQQQINRLSDLEARKSLITVKKLFEIWTSTDLQNRKDKGFETLRSFNKDVFPIIGEMAVADVKKAHIQQIVDIMLARGVRRMTQRVFSELRQFFGFALDRDYVEVDPTARIKKYKIGGSIERDRVLSEQEIINLFQQLPTSGLTETSQKALLIQLSTLTRIGEVLGARWSDIDLERRLWNLPTTKNGRNHVISLTDFSLNLFLEVKRQSGNAGWVFPARNKEGPVCFKTVTKQVADRQRGIETPMKGRTKQTNSLILSGGQWRPHDLRRTGATMMAELGVLPDIIERCLNHLEQSKIKRTYQRAQYDWQMREAWGKLSDRILLLASKPSNVVTLDRAA